METTLGSGRPPPLTSLPDCAGAGDGESAGGILDERGSLTFRHVFLDCARKAVGLDSALHRIRLLGLGSLPLKLRHLTRIRLVLAEVRADTLRAEGEAMALDSRSRRGLGSLLEGIRLGRVEVRGAPLGGWSPEFSVFHGRKGPQRLILGHHWLQKPYGRRGPAFASVHGRTEAGLAAGRFEELWESSHDLSSALRALLEPTLKPQTGDPT